jgi:hypothetical protein
MENKIKNSDPQDHLLLVWSGSRSLPELLMAFTSNDSADIEQLSELHKGELADRVEESLGIKIDPSDLEIEIITYSDFVEVYSDPTNPNRIVLNNCIIV